MAQQLLKIFAIFVFLCGSASAFRARSTASNLLARHSTNLSRDARTYLGGPPPPLKLFSSSWNAYNRIWAQASDADDMIRTVIDGHDEADLVMIGFQEYYDEASDKMSVAERLQSKLWQGVFAEKALGLHQMPLKKIPDEVFEARRKILNKFQVFHGEVDQALRGVFNEFVRGPSSAEHFTSKLKTSLEGVDSILQKHRREDYDEHFSKINSWSEAVESEHRDFLQKNPNFRLDSPGMQQLFGFVKTFKEAPLNASRSIDTRYVDGAKEKIRSMLQDVENAAVRAAAEKIENLQSFMNTWLAAVNRDVGSVGERSPLNLQHSNMLVKTESEIFDSDSQLQKRKSACHNWPANHYNTDLRIFVNPWSGWELDAGSVRKYSIDHNGEVSTYLGTDGQCGKGVNVIKARLEAYTGHKLNVCMLNGHLSFKYPFLHRLYNIKDALESLSGGHVFNREDLHCDIVAFTADFNSRLMCKPMAGNHSSLARALCDTPESPNDGPSGNSFHTIMNTFCNSNGQCSLSNHNPNDHNAQADELTQFLTSDKINCFEYTKKQKDVDEDWLLVEDIDNVLWPMGVSDGHLREAGAPNFAPTYKLAREKDALSKARAWSKCLPGDSGACLSNKEQDYKHNPAWTDRILIKDSERVKITTDLYERRTFTSTMCHKKKLRPSVCSDHAVVTAMLSVDVATE